MIKPIHTPVSSNMCKNILMNSSWQADGILKYIITIRSVHIELNIDFKMI